MASIIAGQQWIKSHWNDIERASGKNASLSYNKFVFWESLDLNDNMEHSARLLKVDNFELITKMDPLPPMTQGQYNELKARRRSIGRTISFNMKAATNLIINIGSENVLDTSIALHPYYGFPVIPGSAIKGVTRHCCEEYLKPEGNIDSGNIQAFFGGEPGVGEPVKGQVIYFDAWPVNINRTLTVDIINPHYRSYYRNGATPPADNDNPIPIPLLAVKKGTEFEFAIGLASNSRLKHEKVLPKVENFVRYTLKTYGIGAKTGSSYGYFE